MAKWSGKIGYIKSVEVQPGVWKDNTVIEHTSYGDMISSQDSTQPTSDSTNSNIILKNSISIIANQFAIENLGYMRYVVIKGVKWKVNDVKYLRPRILITIGGIYNGK